MENPNLGRPLVLGHEGTGIVTHVGRNVTHLKEGDHAIVTWVPRTPVRGRPDVPPSGVTFREEPVHGNVYTWGEDVLVSGEYVVQISKDYPTDVTCLIGCAVLTGAGAVLNTAKVRPGDSVAVFGVGGVGLCAITIDSRLFVTHQRQYRGSLGATYPDKDFQMFLRLYQEGKFPLDKLVTQRYQLKDINEACDALKSGNILGRAIIEY